MSEVRELSQRELNRLIRSYLDGDSSLDDVIEKVAPNSPPRTFRDFLLSVVLPEGLFLRRKERSISNNWKIEDQRIEYGESSQRAR